LFLAITVSAQEPLKSLEEDYYDFLSLLGVTERPVLNYRTLSDTAREIPDEGHPWSEQNLMTTHGLFGSVSARLYGPELFTSYNTTAPYGQNDGALWQGRGLNTSFSAGFRIEGYGFELSFKPLVSFSQNRDFALVPIEQRSEVPRANLWGYWWRGHMFDAPQRFGDDPLFDFDWGDSEIRYTWKTLTAGFGTQSPWLGPSYINPILHSNNAPSYPKLDVGIRRQGLTIPFIDWYAGDIEARIWVGRLTESDFFDNAGDNDHAMFHGLALGYAPSFLPGLTLFANRACIVKWDISNLKYILPESKNTEGENDEDQKMSLGASWLFPQVGFEVYGEIGINDFTPDGKIGYLRYPFHSMVYTVGLKKVLKIGGTGKLYGEIIAEWNCMEQSQDYSLWGKELFYAHRPHGYTNRGQILGAGSGWGGQSQYLELKLYYPKGTTSLVFHRNNPDNNFLYQQSLKEQVDDDFVTKYFKSFKANFVLGVKTDYFLTKNISAGLGVFYNLIINPYYYYTESGAWKSDPWEVEYLHNFSINAAVKCRF
jgi:hypothetical protein